MAGFGGASWGRRWKNLRRGFGGGDIGDGGKAHNQNNEGMSTGEKERG